MQRQIPAEQANLRGRTVVITRPAGTAAALVRIIRFRGGVPLLLPGLSLRPMTDPLAVRHDLQSALSDELLIFSSPAAVRFAAALLPLNTSATVLVPGSGSAGALVRYGVRALVPTRRDSEGLLEHPALREVQGRRIALIGAPGGRGLLREQLSARGARLREVHVYQRVAPRLDRRHTNTLLALPPSALVLLSSAEALGHLCRQLPAPALARLFQATAVVSSERMALTARAAGFVHIVQAASALPADLLDAVVHPG